ncbi:hypothetical protein B0T24DRAFT_675877 [Lasiosphaeria ovina]|uniref:Ubiquitin conjugating enzyme n=1 Tax=Lasiosphaeria ovina TaxID=92902 RepID=A0AAE0NEP2_9PEZI|nr:hypothetical protein B0T24DRAFT_675877 [Lasiosphaeria ovina]
MISGLVPMGTNLMKRAVEEPTELVFSKWTPLVVLINFLLFGPALVWLSYSLGNIYPTLAMIEDPSPPAYEPVSLNEDATSLAEEGPAQSAGHNAGKPTTASLRATRRLLHSVGGWRSHFRGIACAFFIGFATLVLGAIFGNFPVFHSAVGSLIASLTLASFGAAWVHIVISPPNALPFYRRLPPLRKAFEATCFPILTHWAAVATSAVVPSLMIHALNISPSGRNPEGDVVFDNSAIWKSFVSFLVVVALQFLLVVPTGVVLVRVQASLLPPDEDTIVPFDRSFQGKVDPVVVGGKGFVTMRDAFVTFPRSSWIRLYVLYAKVFAVSIATYFLMAAIIIPEMFLLISKKQN